MDGNWTLGVLVGLPVLAVICIGMAVATWLFFAKIEDGEILGWTFASVLALLVGGTALGYFPYSKPYHYWEPVSGTVEKIDSRIINDGEGMSERYVFKIGDDFYEVDDTRAATVEVGDEVDLSCIKEWQWQAAPGWACRWAGA